MGRRCALDLPGDALAHAAAVRAGFAVGREEEVAGFGDHAEAAVLEIPRHILARAAEQRRFHVMDGGRAVHRHRREVTAVHQVDEVGRQTGLDDVPAEQPEDDAAIAPGLPQPGHEQTQIIRGQQPGQTVEPAAPRAGAVARRGRTTEVVDGHLVQACLEREPPHPVQIDFRPVAQRQTARRTIVSR